MPLIEPNISIVVPVYNHWELVPGLIACIIDQSTCTGALELLLVDNGSDWLPDASELPSFARLIHCTVPGSYAARNEGIRHARGDILVFTDADCRPLTQWLEEGVACFKNSETADVIVAGAVSVVPAGNGVLNPYELHDLVLGMRQARYVRRGYGMTANLFVPRSVTEKVGLFEQKRFSGGDAEFCRRAAGYGVSLLYCAGAIVQHPARRSWNELSAKARRIKGGQLTSGPWRKRFLYALRTILPPLWAWLDALCSKKLSIRQRIVVCAVQGRLWIVEISEMVRLLFGCKPARK